MKKADEVIDRFYSFDEEREMYNASERYEMDKYFYAKEQEEKAMNRGINIGVERGIMQRNRDIAINLIRSGVPYNIISQSTGLDESILRGLQ